MLSGWRISDPAFATSKSEILSGEGAFSFGGRWNTKGHRVVYLGGNLATAAMELLVHLDSVTVLNTYSKMEVFFDETHVLLIDPEDLPEDWVDSAMNPATQLIGDDWIEKQESLILKVPCAVIEGEFNYLLNPGHPDFKDTDSSEITLFNYDARVMKAHPKKKVRVVR